MEKIKVGQIVTAVGIKGEVKVYPYTDTPQRFAEIDELLMESKPVKIQSVRFMKNMAILKLSGVDDRNGAEALRGKDLYIDREDMWEMPEDTYLIRDLLGINVIDDKGSPVGRLTDVIQNSSQDLYEIEMEDGRRFLLPAVGQFVRTVDLKKRIMVVRLIEGLVEL